jgi:poly-gamma-glutamate synthesis protein (capsule biosynthesis protein)
VTRALAVQVRALTLAAVGDINLGDGPGATIARFGAAYPWKSVGPTLRGADIAFGNLECAASTRGHAQEKAFTFRGLPSSLAAASDIAGLDVVNLANNHAGDFGTLALLDTLRHARGAGIVPVGAGATQTAAYRPAVVQRLGLRVAFVGFSVIGPRSFRAVGKHPGTAWGFPARVAAGVRTARREGADIVIATFHWGIERDFHENAAQRALARTALGAGATAVIGAHPHVLQPLRTPPGRLIAYSLGNFVFSANSPGTERTGILELSLGARRVLGHRFRRARIVGSRPILAR